ncbi:hypothetical protein [Bradyrhizobium iriomotense]|uniref:Uncharacterized protein n=1 Tax=Bradyrhizobium iriomotense TaxID=441950 RepID=A0ABQ6B1R0_9BRAD|nr:hypothetical protein [Bradyrhizobium iriomotense]GLR88342.1 hypothetical protein GCM10007857_50540 [Bradyrhizobium iriomotense]
MPSTTIELIVSAYVRLKNRRALDDMRELRHRLLKDLQAASGFDSRRAREQVQKDLRVIEQGLEQLRLPQVTARERVALNSVNRRA